MDKITVGEFSGLYTNVDERRLNPEFQSKALNVRYRTGYIQSEGYLPSLVEGLTNVIYCVPVMLDEDKLGSKLIDGRIVSDYTQNFNYYLLTVEETLPPPIHYKLRLNDNLIGEIDSVPLKVIESDGILRILTQNGTLYILQRIKRFFKGDLQQTIIPFYLTKVYDYKDQIALQVENIPAGEISEPKVGQFYYTEQVDWLGGNLWRLKFEFKGLDGEVLSSEEWIDGEGDPDDIQNMVLTVSDEIREIYTPLGQSWDEYMSTPLNIGRLTASFFSIEFVTIPQVIDEHDYREVLLTAVLDDSSEFVIAVNKKILVSPETGMLKVTLTPSQNLSKRITAFGIYVRYKANDDFEQTHYLNLSFGENVRNYEINYISNLTPNGIFLSQTIGFLYDPYAYKPVFNYTDYLELGGIAFATYQSKVYFCSVGKGKIMKEVFYDYIPEMEGDMLADINGDLGVFFSSLSLVAVQDSGEGYLLFSEKPSMNFTIRDQYDLCVAAEGIIIHTENGIYVTNGYERKMISEPVNDIIEKNYSTGNIFYDETNDMLFYICSSGCLRYDFVHSKWNEVYLQNKGVLTFSETGEIYLLSDKKVYKLMKTSSVNSLIKTPDVDLDFPGIVKVITWVIIDFEGELWINFENELSQSRNYNVVHSQRKAVQFGVPTNIRVPSATLGLEFIFKGKVYSIEIYYDVLGEFRNADFIPTPETYPEGLPKTPELVESFRKETQTGA